MVNSGRVVSFSRENIQCRSPHYFCLGIKDGRLEFYTSLPEFDGSVFTSEFGNYLAQTIGVNVTHSPLFAGDLDYKGIQPPTGKDSPPGSKRRRNDYTKFEELESVEMIPLEIGNRGMVEAYYESAFTAFQQINCSQIAKAYIKVIEPYKQVKHPYNGGRGARGEKGDPEETKPDWWPAGVTHRDPDHLKKPERIRLLIHIFRKLGQTYGITTNMLEEAGRNTKSQIKPYEKLDILDEIYKVRRAEECYESGEIETEAQIKTRKRQITLTWKGQSKPRIQGIECHYYRLAMYHATKLDKHKIWESKGPLNYRRIVALKDNPIIFQGPYPTRTPGPIPQGKTLTTVTSSTILEEFIQARRALWTHCKSLIYNMRRKSIYNANTQSLGDNFTGKVTIEWMFLGNIQLENLPMETVFSYIDGVPDKLPWEKVVPIHDILKVLTPGSATVIRFPAAIMFPRAAQGEQAVLTLTIRDLYPASGPKVTAPWKRLALLDQIPRGIDALFFNVMSDSNWNVPAQDILQIAKKWTPQLEGMRQFWSQFSMIYCKDLDKKEDILVVFLKICTKAF
ncbi:hypothetical protein McanCB49686_003732 [Microsporum canis]